MALAVCLITAALFLPVTRNDFVAFDDGEDLLRNHNIGEGLTLTGIGWAFTTGYAGNWHPMTWLSHMLDIQCFGLNPAGHHLVSVLIHAATAGMLVQVLTNLTGRAVPSLLAALLFALHPLRLESVAWASERKDVLAGFFWVATMAVWIRYLRRPGAFRLSLVALSMCLALMSKPSAVTLPFALLLLDWWPAGRFRRVPGEGSGSQPLTARPWVAPVVEKLPLLGLSVAAAVITHRVQTAGGIVIPLALYSWPARISNALVGYGRYLDKTFRPLSLAIFYPEATRGAPGGQVLFAVLLLVAVSLLAWRVRHRIPAALVGWLWFLGTLVPVIGLVKAGPQSIADRYTYLPHIGLFMALAWTGASGLQKRVPRGVPAAAAVIALIWLAFLTRAGIPAWKSSESLFAQAVAAVPDNWWAHHKMGQIRAGQGRLDEAMHHYREAVRIGPGLDMSWNNLGEVLDRLGRADEAEAAFRQALALRPEAFQVLNNLGVLLIKRGRLQEAGENLDLAVRQNPEYAEARNNRGVLRRAMGRPQDAIQDYTEALRLRPDYLSPMINLGDIMREEGRIREAIGWYDRALNVNPGRSDVRRKREALAGAAGT